ncbi:bifunctional oligoribonuclease/PAP phosphatase NrnA [Mycoplasmopsis synoviae]|uniref:DHH family phosphoesterase n=1 Tax=Mycoplasmopsis synoviae TaxID=2109 RepID=UPI000CA1512E|nr:bifunctional oligoribonuclease/PAP phosphatase NrnA [Mycoplasmopsis synoviae]AKJ20558.1 3'-to-5' oligoribonuclease A [Mycoplasmopsis synoviae]AQU47878.1 3'-to-5' oligoribonuclease A [Mycoplasmopsis synoviae]AWL84127.1 DHH family phosphoesterase [Mycoplasmopsis synoviae]QLE13847.1 bifunctional oligoribonuclease/PAP phosphatase NrnA [Mycoplasmopsis synoviae]UZF64624.1 bifunctional oligoribonuclease/PAP phosphatase NrnA [Mycoplasmopsis synoviae]
MKINSSKIAREAIEKYQNIIIFHHIRPDGDCLGSQFGLAELIRDNYPDKKVYCLGNNYNSFEFMDFKFDKFEDIDFSNSLAIVNDTSSGDRIEEAQLLYENKTTAKLRIDHHPNDSDIKYDYLWVDSSYVAAAEMIAKLAYDSKWKVSQRASSFIYLGINTDSGRFLYPATSRRTYNLVGFLMKNKFHPSFILKNLSKRSLKGLKFTGHLLSNFQKDGRVLYYYASQETQKQFDLNSYEIAMFVNELANIEDNLIWVLFIELEDKKVRGRLRSSGPQVNLIAKEFNGGGHENASGITLDSIDEIPKVLAKLNAEILKYENGN